MKRIRRVWFAAAIVLLVAASAGADDFESAFQGLGSSSRKTILESIEKLASELLRVLRDEKTAC